MITPIQAIKALNPAASNVKVKSERAKEPDIGLLADVFSPTVQQALTNATDFAVVLGPGNQTYLILPEDSTSFAQQSLQASKLNANA